MGILYEYSKTKDEKQKAKDKRQKLREESCASTSSATGKWRDEMQRFFAKLRRENKGNHE